jgi:hypothetical protein
MRDGIIFVVLVSRILLMLTIIYISCPLFLTGLPCRTLFGPAKNDISSGDPGARDRRYVIISKKMHQVKRYLHPGQASASITSGRGCTLREESSWHKFRTDKKNNFLQVLCCRGCSIYPLILNKRLKHGKDVLGESPVLPYK